MEYITDEDIGNMYLVLSPGSDNCYLSIIFLIHHQYPITQTLREGIVIPVYLISQTASPSASHLLP